MMKILDKMCRAPGHVSLYYRPLEGGCGLHHNENEPLIAASVIKIPIMVEAFRRFEEGSLNPQDVHVLKEDCSIICLSALLTTTMGVMGDVVKAAEEAGIRDRVKIMIGGAPVNEHFCTEIGADAYTPDAASAADKAMEYFA